MSDVSRSAGGEPDGPPTRRPRGSRTMQVVTGLLLGVLGFALVAQSSGTTADQGYSHLREQDLIDLITGFGADRQRAADDLAAATAESDQLRTQIAQAQATRAAADRTTRWASIVTGLEPVTGAGLRITITDPSRQVRPETLLNVVHELRAADATMMEINDSVRFTADTWIGETADQTIVVDGQELQPPYVIDVLGAPATLAGALTFARGPQFQISQLGGTLDWQESEHVAIKSTRDRVDNRYLQPAGTGR